MFKRAFSYIETIVAVFICLIILIPTIKINLKQVYTYRKANEYEQDLMFSNSLSNYIKSKQDFFEIDRDFIFNSYEELKKEIIFGDFYSTSMEKRNDKFNLEIKIKYKEIDFYLQKYPANLIKLNYHKDKISFSQEILKFKE